MMRQSLVALLLAGALGVSAQTQEAVDLVLHDGKIFTAEELLSTYSSIAIRDGRIVALGWDALPGQYRAARTIDLGGRLVTPGFIDTHIHISGDPERWVDLAGLENMSELKARVTRKAEQLGSGGLPAMAGRRTSSASSGDRFAGISTTPRRSIRSC